VVSMPSGWPIRLPLDALVRMLIFRALYCTQFTTVQSKLCDSTGSQAEANGDVAEHQDRLCF